MAGTVDMPSTERRNRPRAREIARQSPVGDTREISMKRKLKWLAIVLAVSLLGFGAALFLWPRVRITAESYNMIEIGMTEKEVEGILGGPGKSELLNMKNVAKEKGLPIIEMFQGQIPKPKIWKGRRGIVQIQLDEESRVSGKSFLGFGERSSFIDRLRDWLGW